MHLPSPPGRRRPGAALVAAAVALSGLTLVAPAQAQAAVDGALTSGDTVFPNVGNGGYDALHYDLDIAWTPVYNSAVPAADGFAQSTIEATTTMRARAEQPLRSFSLDFEGLTVTSVTVNGVPATWERIEDLDAIKHKLVITPVVPVEGEFSTTIAYSGVPKPHFDADGSQEGWSPVADGAVVLGQPVGMMAAFPHNNTPKDKATYTIDLDVPTTITNGVGTGNAAAVSNGELIARTASPDGSRTTWSWKQKYPMASELAVIGIGKYDVLESTVTLSDGREIPEWTFVDSALSAGNKTTINNRRAQFSRILQGLEGIFGPYPGDSTGAIIDTVPRAINYALETQDRSFFPSTSGFNGSTLIHEFVHQWYGNHVSPDDWNGLWMGEGMASWAPGYYDFAIARTTTSNPSATHYNVWNNTVAGDPKWQIAPAGMTDSATLYEWQTYTRGAMVWEALRQSVGDKAYFTLIREWMTQKGGTSQSVAAFQAFAEQVSGRDLSGFFTEWVHTPAKPTWPTASLGAVSIDAGPAGLGDTVAVDLAVNANGRRPLSGTQYTVDIAEALEVSEIDASALPAELELSGTTLTWNVPATAVGGRARTSFGLRITDAAAAVSADITLAPVNLGAACDDTCVTTLRVKPTYLDAIETPEISGDVQVGRTVRIDTERYPAATTTYQWLLDGVAVDGARGRSFQVPASALGSELSVQVIGTRATYAETVATSASHTVQAGDLKVAPVPRVTGKPVVGTTLTALPGTWDDGVSLTYQWLRDGEAIAGATASTYTLGAADAGSGIAVEVTGVKTGYAPQTRTSGSVGPVAEATAPAGPGVVVTPPAGPGVVVTPPAGPGVVVTPPAGPGVVVTPPAGPGVVVTPLTGRVTLKGTAKTGKKLTAKVTGFGSAKRTYVWTVGGKKVGFKSSLKLKKSWAGKKVTVTVTATQSGRGTGKATASKKIVKVKKR